MRRFKDTREWIKSDFRINNASVGERLEVKIVRILRNNEPIKDGSPLIYTERKDGIIPEFDIRTDKFDLLIESAEEATNIQLTQRAELDEALQDKTPEEGGGEPTSKHDAQE